MQQPTVESYEFVSGGLGRSTFPVYSRHRGPVDDGADKSG